MKRILLALCLAVLTTAAQAQTPDRHSTSRSRTTARPALTARALALPILVPNPGCAGQRIISAYYQVGTRTASGARFNPNGLTAAHRSLPFGTRLVITNPHNGRSVTVIVNDRGPFVRGVGLDLSLGAAKAIGMRSTGAVCMARAGVAS